MCEDWVKYEKYLFKLHITEFAQVLCDVLKRNLLYGSQEYNIWDYLFIYLLSTYTIPYHYNQQK